MQINLLRCVYILASTVLISSSLLAQNKANNEDLNNSTEVFFNKVEQEIRGLSWADLDSTRMALNMAISHFKTDSQYCQVSYYNALKGRLFFEEEKNDSSTSAFIEASKYAYDSCSSFNSYYLYNSWSILYLNLKDYDLADSVSQIALVKARQSGESSLELNVLTNQAVIYSEQKKYDAAINKMKSIEEIAAQTDDMYHKWSSLQNLGAFYSMKEDYDSALYYFNLFKKSITDETPISLIMDYYNNLGVIYEERGQHNKALEYYKSAIDLAKENQSLNSLLLFLKNHSDNLELIGRHQESRTFLNEYVNLKDSLYSLEKLQIVKELEKEYESSKQKEKIHQLENSKLENKLELEQSGRVRDVISLILTAVLIFAIAIYRRLRYIKRSKHLVEKAKKRSEDLLLNILPAQVAEELKQNGKTEATYHETVSVLFTDFIKFTEFTQSMSPKDMVDEIGICFKAFDEISTKFDIEKIKTIGDSFMAAGGVPLPDKKAAEHTVRAAIEMQEFLENRYKERTENGLLALKMRSGINSGSVVAGIVGVKKFQYDIWGDTVNTASRLESYGDSGKVNISSSTYDLVKEIEDFKFESRGKIKVKGKGEIEMYYVTIEA